jgi:hypothetical protein
MESGLWQVVGGIVGLIVLSLTFAGFWMSIAKQIAEAKSEAELAKSAAATASDEAKSSGLRAVQANLKIDTLGSELSNFKEYAAREYVDRDRLRESTEHHDTQYSALKEDLRGITARLDKLLERGFPPIGA